MHSNIKYKYILLYAVFFLVSTYSDIKMIWGYSDKILMLIFWTDDSWILG